MISKNISLVDNTQDLIVPEYKVYKKRWLILFLFVMYGLSNRIQFIIYSVIANKLVRYYGVSFTLIELTSVIGIIEYLIFNIPASYLITRLGLRRTVLIGLVGTCIGSWIKVGSVDPSKYWVLMLGQSLTAGCQPVIAPLPGRIAAVWFPHDEVSKAASIGVAGILLSSFLGFIISPLVVSGNSIDEIEDGLNILSYSMAIFSTVLLPIMILCDEAPPVSPSAAQVAVKTNKRPFKESLKAIVTNRSFMIFLLIFGICAGMALPMGIILNEVVLLYHPDAEKHIGFIGAATLISSLFGAITFGSVLDKFKRFKETAIFAFVCIAVTLIMFTYTISVSVYATYVTASLLGFFGLGISLTSLALSLELTHPEPEGTVAGLLVSIDKTFELLFVFLLPYLFNNKSIYFTTILIACILAVTLSLFFFMKFDLKRQRAEDKSAELRDATVTNK